MIEVKHLKTLQALRELRLSRSRCGDVASDAIRPVSPV